MNHGRFRRRLKKTEARLDRAAERAARGLLEKVEANEDGGWIDYYLDWQDEFEFAPAGAGLVAECYAAKRYRIVKRWLDERE